MEQDRDSHQQPVAGDADQINHASSSHIHNTPGSSNASTSRTTSRTRSRTTAAPSIASTTASVAGMTIALPFSSHNSALDVFPQQDTTSQSENQGTMPSQEEDGSTARPMAIKPIYKKRVVPASTQSDGIIRRSGTVAAIEKNLSIGTRASLRSSGRGKSIYDEPTSVSTPLLLPETPPTSAPVAAPIQTTPAVTKPTRTKKTPAPPKAKRKRGAAAAAASLAVISNPPQPEAHFEQDQGRARKRVRYKKQILWRPTAPLTAGVTAEERSRPTGLKRPPKRDEAIEQLVKKQELDRERMVLMAQKPMALRELQALVEAQLAAEDKTLMNLGITLHKELLKLQLEEGALLQMLHAVRNGVLDPSDLRRVGSGRERYELKTVLRKPMQVRQSMPMDSITSENRSKVPSATGDDTEGNYSEEDGGEHGGGGDYNGEDDENEEEEDEDEEEEEEEEEEEVGQSDALLRELEERVYPSLGESYASRPIVPITASNDSSTGRPVANIQPSTARTTTMDDIKKLVVERARRRIQSDNERDREQQENEGQEEPEEAENDDDDYMEVVDYDEEEQGELGEPENSSEEEYVDEDEEDGEEEEEEDEEEEDMDDDDEKARAALQKLLEQFGGNLN
ncbi:hypothetical protein BGZ83_003650 [Gryganskiella cystojenkinii]|nr:hypothetical protein BGZ83_003650 [Gryganskiella cystojenkinii]